jgi:hypothetical protein
VGVGVGVVCVGEGGGVEHESWDPSTQTRPGFRRGNRTRPSEAAEGGCSLARSPLTPGWA